MFLNLSLKEKVVMEVNRYFRVLFSISVVIITTISNTFSDELGELGRKVFQQYASSVVTVRANLLITMSDGEEETVGQCTAVLVHPSGVGILALSALDPSILLDQELRNTINIRIASIKMILKDEKEIPAEVLLQDKERDIMVIRAKESLPEELSILSLEKENIGVPQLLDPLLLIMQHGKVARRVHTATIMRVESIIDKPFPFYTLDSSRSFDILSSPLFTMDGKFVGIGTLRVAQEWKEDVENNSIIIVLPVEQIIPLIKEGISIKQGVDTSNNNETKPQN